MKKELALIIALIVIALLAWFVQVRHIVAE